MSSVTITFPKSRLAKLLRQPGGKSVSAALADAEAALDLLAIPCAEALDVSLGAIDRLLAEFAAAPGAPTANALYLDVKAIIGVATTARLPDMDHAAFSLCELLDWMNNAGKWDVGAVVVHVQALHYLRQPAALAADTSVRAVLMGLKRVREKIIANA